MLILRYLYQFQFNYSRCLEQSQGGGIPVSAWLSGLYEGDGKVMPVKLIAFDLDGTLLDERKNIPEENMQALSAAAEAGTLLVPATGRIFTGIPEILRQLPGSRFFITINGAYVYDAVDDRNLYTSELSVDTCLRLIDYMDGLPVIYDCYQDNWGYITRSMFQRAGDFIPDPGIMKMMRELRTPVDDLAETLRQKGRPVQKMQMHFQDLAERDRQMKLVAERFPETAVSYSLPWNIEINSAGATKGQALKALCLALGIDLADVLAFGDGTNDLDMIRTAGIGVAMGNGAEEVKAAADWIAPSNEECGVAAGIRKFMGIDRG